MLDFTPSRLPPFQHQREDAETLFRLPYVFITSEMRTGKTKIVIDAAQFLFEAGQIDRVIVVAPAPVRDVWFDRELGELQKHLWLRTKAAVIEFHGRIRKWQWDGKVSDGADPAPGRLTWVVTNYEFLRSKQRLHQLSAYCSHKTLLVLDESSFVKTWDSMQTKACKQLRSLCGRVVLLNGTPISHSPLDLFSQGNLLHASILQCPYVTHFKARYAVQAPVLKASGKPVTVVGKGGREHVVQKIESWVNLEDLRRRFAPYTIRRLQKDCLDLPPKLDPVTITAELTPDTWRMYKDMRDELVVWLEDGNVATAPQAGLKVLRLAQITSGFLGGVEDAGLSEETAVLPEFFESLDLGRGTPAPFEGIEGTATPLPPRHQVVEIGREKLDVLFWFLKQRLEADPVLHVVVWCRFRPELFRMLEAVAVAFPQFEIGAIHGLQKSGERKRALALLKPETSPKDRPVFVGGTYGTGSFGLDFTAAHTSINCSADYALGKYLQSADRVYGPAQTSPVAYFDIVAVGPKGQKTIDHAIVKARRERQDIATWTTAAWIRALKGE